VKAPHSLDAEKSVIGQLLRGDSQTVAQVIGAKLDPKHFYAPAHKIIAAAIYENHFADMPIDPITIGERVAKSLASQWSVDEREAVARVRGISTEAFHGRILDHAVVVQQKHSYREILDMTSTIEGEVEREDKSPEEIAGLASKAAMEIATDSLLTSELIHFGDMGRNYYRQAQEAKSARERGVDIGAKFGMPFIDDYTRGLRKTELYLGAGEPGVGKSAVFVKAALRFASRQYQRPEGERIGTLILSLEMGEEPTNMRLASAVTGIDGGKLREGRITDGELGSIAREWGRRKEIPLWFNFASNARASQLRALVVEGIRSHNTGLIIIDHFRHFGMDNHYQSQLQEDEDKVKFLKESIAGDLGCAVICLCHTTKGIADSRNSRPNLTHLRGSYQVAAAADFVSFIHQPYMYATDDQRESGEVTEQQMENIWEKNRHGYKGIAQFQMEAARMHIE
jgi:replicative DNA helicase